jgi:RND family efflux transporter MFP subunit
VDVVTAKATRGDLPLAIPVVGAVRADEGALVTLSSRAGGRVALVSVRAGDDVKKGAPILRFEKEPLELAAGQARAALAAASNQLDEFERIGRDRQEREFDAVAKQTGADVAAAEKTLERVAALRRDGLAAEKTETEARQSLDRAQRERDAAAKSVEAFRTAGADLQHATLVAARDAAAASLKDAEAVLADAVVVAPGDGRVSTLSAHLGDRVESGAAVGTLLRPTGRVVVFGVTPAQAASIRPGSAVTWNDGAGCLCAGEIRSIAADVAGSAGLVEVTATPCAGPTGEQPCPQPGLFVRGEIETSRLAGAVLVPAAAVVRDDDATIVVTVGEGGISKHVRVEVLGRHGGLAAVKGDVKDGDRVVVEGGYNLPDGAKTHEGPAKDEADDEKKPGTGK